MYTHLPVCRRSIATPVLCQNSFMGASHGVSRSRSRFAILVNQTAKDLPALDPGGDIDGAPGRTRRRRRRRSPTSLPLQRRADCRHLSQRRRRARPEVRRQRGTPSAEGRQAAARRRRCPKTRRPRTRRNHRLTRQAPSERAAGGAWPHLAPTTLRTRTTPTRRVSRAFSMSEARNKSSADRKLDRPGNLGGSNSWGRCWFLAAWRFADIAASRLAGANHLPQAVAGLEDSTP
jgi:hypothetical protein